MTSNNPRYYVLFKLQFWTKNELLLQCVELVRKDIHKVCVVKRQMMRVLLLVVHPNFTSCIITRDATLNISFNFFRTFTILLQFWSTSMEDRYICYKSEFFIGWVWKGGRKAGKMDHFFIDFPSSLFAHFILEYLIPVHMYFDQFSIISQFPLCKCDY